MSERVEKINNFHGARQNKLGQSGELNTKGGPNCGVLPTGRGGFPGNQPFRLLRL